MNNNAKNYYNVNEAAELINISTKMIYKLIKLEQMPYLKIGTKILIPAEQFQQWLTSNTHNVN